MATWRKCCNFITKQLLGQFPSNEQQLRCLYTLSFPSIDCSGFTGYDFNGFDNINDYINSIGGYFVQDGNPNCLPFYFDSGNALNMYYVGESEPPPLLITYPDASQETYFYGSVCSFGCLTTNAIQLNNSPYYWGYFGVFGINNTNFINFGGALDFSDLVSCQTTLDLMIQTYQPGSSCTVDDAGSGFVRITFNNVYYNPILMLNGFQLLYDIGGTPTFEFKDFSIC